MSSEDLEKDQWILCAGKDGDGNPCDGRIKNHAWGKVKSSWFFSKSGESWCPKHIPDWVAKWREIAARKKVERAHNLGG